MRYYGDGWPNVFKGYDPSSSDDNPYINSTFQADLQAISGNWTFKGLDEAAKNNVRMMTMLFDALDAEDLAEVWLEAKVKSESGFANDSMVLDLVSNKYRIDQMEGFNSAGGDMTLIYDFDPSEFALLEDGQLNLAFFDDTRVDWVTLHWVPGTPTSAPLGLSLAFAVPEPSTLGLIGFAGLLSVARRRRTSNQV